MKFPPFFWTCLALTTVMVTGCESPTDGLGSATINDPNWSAGADTLASITTPYFDTNASIFALVRNDTTKVQRLLSGHRGDKTFSSTQLATNAKYNDIAAVRITQSKDGERKTDYAIIGCAQDGSLELFLASDPNNIRSATPTSATRCASVSADPINYSDGDNVRFRMAYNSGSANVGTITFDVDLFYSSSTAFGVPLMSSVSVDSSGFSMRAIEGQFISDTNAIPVYAMQSSNDNKIMAVRYFPTQWQYYSSTTNPFTGITEPFDVTDLVLAPDHGLYMVSEDQGLVGLPHTTISGVGNGAKKLSGDGSRCIDALAWDGDNLWCHDATSEGRLIRFSPPATR